MGSLRGFLLIMAGQASKEALMAVTLCVTKPWFDSPSVACFCQRYISSARTGYLATELCESVSAILPHGLAPVHRLPNRWRERTFEPLTFVQK